MYAKLFARDLALFGIAILFWKLGAGFSAGQGLFGDVAGVVAGLSTGVCVFLLHEWGHWLGAVATGSTIVPAKSLASPFLFSYDSRQNSRQQFLVMSFGGWIASAAVALAAFAWLSPELFAARVARGVVGLNVVLIVLIEVPLVVFSLLTGRVPPVENQRRAVEA
jgi:hypothetical protein